ncbi:MAG: LTA synthase family protein, partial [Opitutaceae bacterium]|nr:LTA synthase family protein [Opitutaceae bacterium]
MIVLLLFLAVSLATRLALLAKAAALADWGAALPAAFATGMVFDLGAGLVVAALAAVFLGALPARVFVWKWTRALAWPAMTAVIGALLFGAVAEWVFWDEFGVRFNFIAVDYL